MSWILWTLGIGTAMLASSYNAEGRGERRDAGLFPAPGRMIDAGGGRRLHVLSKGGSGPTVVIEQGAGSPSILWWPIQNRVAEFARAVTYDRAGYQWSDPGPRKRSMQDRVADLHTVLAELPGPFVLVAHSFGGPLIRLYAQAYPNQVAGMVLVDTPEEGVIFRPSYRGYTQKMGWFARAAEFAARFGLIRVALHWMRDVPEGLGADDFRALKAMIAKPDFFRAMADDPAALSRGPTDFGHEFGDKPLAVICHGQPFPGPAAVLEPGWMEGQQRLAAMSSRGELIVARNSNHMVQTDEPDIVVAAIRRVAEQVRAMA
jgi:pimeloyl-ACP methyl ester carboxylesterase